MIDPQTKGIYLADVRGIIRYRDTKHCVCVSAGNGIYYLVDTLHRAEYNDFQIKASNYAFLNGKDRYVSCVPVAIPKSRLLCQVGVLSDTDTKTMYLKTEASHKIQRDEKKALLTELWKTFK